VDDIIDDSVFHICVFISALNFKCRYVCYPARNWQLKVFMKEISLFVAIITYPYSVFWEARRDIVLLVSEPGLMPHIYNQAHIYDNHSWNWVNSQFTTPLTPYSYTRSSKFLEPSPDLIVSSICMCLHTVIIS